MTSAEDGERSAEASGDRRRRRLAGWVGLLLGVGLLAFVASRSEIAEVASALRRGGFALLALALFYPLRLVAHSEAWRLVFPADGRPGRPALMAGMWIAHSVNFLLPTATIGGDVVRGRVAILRGAPEANTVASLVADKTAHAASILALLALGLVLAAVQGAGRGLLWSLALATILLGAGVAIFVRIQRSSGVSGLLDRWSGGEDGLFRRASVAVRHVEGELDEIYAKPRGFALAAASRVAGTVVMAAEVWAASRLLGTPLSVADAVTLKVVGVGVRGAAFFVWGGLGLQEGAYALLAPLTGLSPSGLVAVSLATRVRELVVAAPGVTAWLAGEGLRAARRPASGGRRGDGGGP